MLQAQKERQPKLPVIFGGDKGDRTPDLMAASHALSQLSYIPINSNKRLKARAILPVFQLLDKVENKFC